MYGCMLVPFTFFPELHAYLLTYTQIKLGCDVVPQDIDMSPASLVHVDSLD